MGLRHRTPISVLREQRRSADQEAEAASRGLSPLKAAASRRHLLRDEKNSSSAAHNQASTLESDLALLLRLRSSLAPSKLLEEGARSACQALEDEIRRLGQLQAQAAHSTRRLPEDTQIEPSVYPQPDQDDLPYRYLKIVPPPATSKAQIQRLDVAPRDLSAYHCGPGEQRRPESGKALSLVSVPLESEERQSDRQEASGPSEEAAAFVHQILKPAESTDESQRLPQKLVLSLLDT